MIPEKLQLFDIAWADSTELLDKTKKTLDKGIHIQLKKDGDAQNITYKVYLTPEESRITYQFLDNDDYVEIKRKITNVTAANGKCIKIKYEYLDPYPEYKYVSFDIPEPEKLQGWRLSKQDVLNKWNKWNEFQVDGADPQKVELRL